MTREALAGLDLSGLNAPLQKIITCSIVGLIEAAALALVASPAAAQLAYVPAPAAAPDLSAYAKSSDVTAAMAAAVPSTCGTAPASDTLNGSTGTGTPCTPRADATRATVVQRANATTDASGSFSVTWSRSFVSSTPVVSVKPVLSAGTKGDCGFTTVNATTASGSCWTYQSVVVSILGSTVNPVASAAAGIRVMLVGGEPTQ